jgi:hypothetical protein
MTKQTPKKKTFPWLSVLAGLAVFAIVLTSAGLVFAASKESHDPFCASCHTQPESDHYQRSIAADKVDLASYHAGEETRCIDCHSGRGIPGRVAAELMGARNALKWYTGTAVQPAPLIFPIGNGNCLKCHDAVTQRGYVPKVQNMITAQGGGEEGFMGHWHVFLSRWRAIDKNAAGCVDCHSGHATGSTSDIGYLDRNTLEMKCEGCHQRLKD